MAQLHFTEAEVFCRLFAQEYNLPADEVIKVGLTEVINKYPDFKDVLLPSEQQIRNLNLPSLKNEMRARHLKIGGKKTELQHRLIGEVKRIQALLNLPVTMA